MTFEMDRNQLLSLVVMASVLFFVAFLLSRSRRNR